MVVAIAPAGGSRMSNRRSSAPNSEQGLTSIPMAGGGLSRLAVARLESAGVPVAPLLRRVGLTPELIADPEQRLSVQSQIRLLDEAAIALKDDCLGFTLARDHDPSRCPSVFAPKSSENSKANPINSVKSSCGI
jgi:Arabinose-binding domain of AraC transcription regulator, N-term